jgi:hypothetical protein
MQKTESRKQKSSGHNDCNFQMNQSIGFDNRLFYMTNDIIISAITSAAAIISAYFSYKAKVVSRSTHTSVNGRLDELMTVAKKLAHAEGKAEESKEEAIRQKGKKK